MMVAAPGKDVTCFEYRETAPAAAKVDLFADGKVTWLNHKAAGVPGTVRGLALAHAKFGKLPWKDVVLPAVKLAEDGFTVNARARERPQPRAGRPEDDQRRVQARLRQAGWHEVESRRHARAEGPRPHAAADRREAARMRSTPANSPNCSRRR